MSDLNTRHALLVHKKQRQVRLGFQYLYKVLQKPSERWSDVRGCLLEGEEHGADGRAKRGGQPS